MWVIYMLIYYTEQFGKFLVELFYFIWKYTIFYFFMSVTENPESPHEISIKNNPQMRISRGIKSAKEQ